MLEKYSNEDVSINKPKKRVNLAFKILSNISLYLTLIAISWAIVEAMMNNFNKINGLCICILFIIAFICFVSLPWVKRILSNPKISILFLIFSGVIGLLMIILSTLVFLGKNGEIIYNLLKIILIVCIQFFIMSSITNSYFKYKKDRISLQIIHCLCYAYFDFYVSTLIININFSGDGYNSSVYKKLMSTPFLQIFVVSIVVFTVSKLWFKIIENRSKKLKLNLDYSEEKTQKNENKINADTNVDHIEDSQQSIEERMQKIKTLYDMNLLSKEEYESKKQSIIDEI